MNRCPRTWFSTEFHTGKRLLRARLNDLLTAPRRRGTAPLVLALFLTLTAGSLAALGRQVEVIDRKMEELSLIRSRLLHRCGQMEQAQKYLGQEAPVLVEEAPAQCLLIREVAPPYSLREISIATKECFAQAFQEKLPIFFQSGVTVPLERVQRGEYIQASHAFLPIEDTDRAENIRRLPGGKCAAIYHVGDYQSIGRSYRRLLDYCQDRKSVV